MNKYDTVYEKFKTVTGYDIHLFFKNFVSFVNNYYPDIIDYYNNGVINREAFFELEKLSKEVDKIEPLFILHRNTLDNIGMWFLLDSFSEIKTKLMTIKMSFKWLRSSYTAYRTNNIEVNKVLSPGQNFEEVSRELHKTSPQDDWMQITIPQYINEEDYSVENGSRIFSVNLKNVNINRIDDVVDSLNGKNLLGKDISADFSFEDGDLKIVSFEEAIKQALDLILQSLQGAIPEFPEYGIPNEFIGTNINSFKYPSIFKAIMNMFQSDDRWRSVELLEIGREKDSIFLKLKVTTITESDFIIKVPI